MNTTTKSLSPSVCKVKLKNSNTDTTSIRIMPKWPIITVVKITMTERGRDLTRSIFSALVDFSHHGDRKSSSFPGVIFYPALAAEWKMKNLKVKKSPLAVVDQRRRFVGFERPPNTPRKRTSAPSSLTMIPGKGKSWGASLIHTNRRRRRGAIPFAVDCTKSQWSNACWF